MKEIADQLILPQNRVKQLGQFRRADQQQREVRRVRQNAEEHHRAYAAVTEVHKEDLVEQAVRVAVELDVGVAPVEDDGIDFNNRIKEIQKELLELQEESNCLMGIISRNLEEMGL